MMNTNSILTEYRNGDFETRLSLFLNYRDFRNEFIKIDHSESDRKSAGKEYADTTQNAMYGLGNPRSAGI